MDPDFLLLANALSALYLKQSEEIPAVGRHAFGCSKINSPQRHGGRGEEGT